MGFLLTVSTVDSCVTWFTTYLIVRFRIFPCIDGVRRVLSIFVEPIIFGWERRLKILISFSKGSVGTILGIGVGTSCCKMSLKRIDIMKSVILKMFL